MRFDVTDGLVFVSVNIIKQITVTTETLMKNITTLGVARREGEREGGIKY